METVFIPFHLILTMSYMWCRIFRITPCQLILSPFIHATACSKAADKPGHTLLSPLLTLTPFVIYFGGSIAYCLLSEVALSQYPIITVRLCREVYPLWRWKGQGGLEHHVCCCHCACFLILPHCHIDLCCAVPSWPLEQTLFMSSIHVEVVTHTMLMHICHSPLRPTQRYVRTQHTH